MFPSSIRTKPPVLLRFIRSIITTNLNDGVQTITMCDTKTRNSLSIPMMEKLIEAIDESSSDRNCRSIILTAEEGPIFSAGHNLKELNDGVEQQTHVFELATALMYAVIDAPVPVIARVDGLAAAAGCQLVAQCDLAFCTEASGFSTPGANFGIFCSTPGVALARTVRRKAAMRMLLTGAPISGEEALQAGLVNEVSADANEMDARITAVCASIGAKSRDVVELGKRFFYKQADVSVREAFAIGGQQMVANLQLADGKEGVRSFVEKRKPVWGKVIS